MLIILHGPTESRGNLSTEYLNKKIITKNEI